MADTIIIDKSLNRSTQTALIIPDTDGIFIIQLEAKAEANGKAPPVVWAEAFINGRSDKKTDEIGWEDGLGAAWLTTSESLEARKEYAILGVSGNRNARAVSIEMTIKRAGT